MLKFIILSENRDNDIYKGESGLSVYLDIYGNRFLLDTGYSSLFLENATKLGLDIDNLDLVVFTHGHSDHTNGIAYLSPGKKIIMHPEGFKERYSKRKKEYVGFPMTLEELKEKHNVLLTK